MVKYTKMHSALDLQVSCLCCLKGRVRRGSPQGWKGRKNRKGE